MREPGTDPKPGNGTNRASPTLPLFATTLAGSLPKPKWLAEPEKLWAPWKLEGEALAEGKRDAVRLAVAMLERAGIDILSDGEQTRRHFVNGYMEKLQGIDFKNLKTVRIRNRYDADVPRVVDRVARPFPVHTEDAKLLRACTDRAIKFTLPGPMTMVDTLHDEHYGSREKLAMAFAEILNLEARELAAAGVDVVQFDEPAFNVYFDEVRDWGVAALMRAREGVPCKTAVHICYGYGIEANNAWKKTLGDEWRQYERTFPLLAQSKIDQVSLECANSHVPIELIELLEGKDVLVGCIDVANPKVEQPEDVAKVIRAAMKHVPKERLFPCTNCGMVPLAREVAAGKLAALGAGAAIVRREITGL
ncbi:MAG TPA: methionine synthase [Usitatibacter sp.]|nr:methionine synthase [Usitatibacter sp.]